MNQSKEPSAWAMKAADDLAKHLRCDCDHCAFVAALVVDAAYAPLIELLEDALPCVEESEQFNKPTCRELSKRIRAALSKSPNQRGA